MFLGMLFVAASAMAGLILAHASGGILDLADVRFRSRVYVQYHARLCTEDGRRFHDYDLYLGFNHTSHAALDRFLGYASAVLLILGSGYLDVALFLFPAWVLLVSVYILIDNLRRPRPPLG